MALLRDLGDADMDDVFLGKSLSGRTAMRTHGRTSIRDERAIQRDLAALAIFYGLANRHLI